MTAIIEFRISKLAGRKEEIHRKLDPKLNIFWGLNGTGKTTLLRILSSALKNDATKIMDLAFEKAEVVFFSHHYGVEIVRKINRKKLLKEGQEWARKTSEITLDEQEYWEDLSPRPYSVTKDDEPIRWETSFRNADLKQPMLLGGFKHSYLPISRQLGQDVEPSYLSIPGTDPDEQFVHRVNRVWRRYRTETLAKIRDVQQKGLAEVLSILFGGQPTTNEKMGRDSAIEDSPDEAFELVSAFLSSQRLDFKVGKSDFIKLYNDSKPYRHVVASIRAVISTLDQILAPQKKLQEVVNSLYIGEKHLLLGLDSRNFRPLKVEVEDGPIPLSSLSSGERQLLQILVETLAVEESVIMIDEPELSMHPDWQLELVRSMRSVNSDAQFILATHSPELMYDVSNDCVFEL